MKKTNEICFIEKYLNIFDYRDFDKLSNSDKTNFLFQKGIYSKTEFKKQIKTEEKNKYTFEFFVFEKNCYYEIKDEIIESYYEFLNINCVNQINKSALNNFKFIYDKTIGTEKKLKFLKDKYKQELKFLSSSISNKLLFNEPYYSFNNYKDYVKIEESFSSSLLECLGGKRAIPYGELIIDPPKFLDLWIKGTNSKIIFDFCKTEIERISISHVNSQKKESKISNNNTIVFSKSIDNLEKSNYPTIFKDLFNENIFYNYLLQENLINEKKEIIKKPRLIPNCHAFFIVSNDPSNKDLNVFKKNVEKKDFEIIVRKIFDITFSRFPKTGNYEFCAQDFFNNTSNFKRDTVE